MIGNLCITLLEIVLETKQSYIRGKMDLCSLNQNKIICLNHNRKQKQLNINGSKTTKRSVLHDPNYEGWHLKDDGYWWERREIKPKAFKTTVNVSVVKFDNISLKDAIGSCFCEMDAYIDTYPEAFIIDKGAETSLNMGVCKCH